ncbi:DUF4351 domain-containing protein [Thermoanaerobacteraceae bacterium SP2]|nr:DUF4351 domain-containing protein [Thermoanaerobacteraceae bacterium SP2]
MLDFLGLHTAPIAEVVPTELPYIEARRINEDYIFRLQDDTLLHLEYQSTLALDITLKTIETIKKMKNRQSEIDQLIATVIILADKLLDEQTIEKLWEEFKMLNVFKYAEERGKKEGFQEGIEEGIEKGIEKGMVETIIKQLCKKLGDLPQEYKERIIGQDKATLEMLAENIFDIFSLNDLDRFLKN